MATATRKPLTAADLSNQPSVYYVGCAPLGDTVTMWSYSHRIVPKKAAPMYMFEDCMSPYEQPFFVGFTIAEVQARLRLVGR